VVQPYVEGSLYDIAKVGGGVFNPMVFYGGNGRRWSVTGGLKLHWRMPGHRMGRYEEPAGMGEMEEAHE